MDYHDAHGPYIGAVASALTAAGLGATERYADPNDPRDGTIQITPAGILSGHTEVWVCWQEERGWWVLTEDERSGGREPFKGVTELRIATVASPETVTNAVIELSGLDVTAPGDSYADADFPVHEFDEDDPAFEAALAAYHPAEPATSD